MNWNVVQTIIVTMLTSGAITGVITVLGNRRKVKVDAAVALSDAALRQVNELQEQATSTKQQLDQTARQARTLSEMLDRVTAKVRSVMLTIHDPLAIHDPVATIERLRVMVPYTPEPAAENGSGPHA